MQIIKNLALAGPFAIAVLAGVSSTPASATTIVQTFTVDSQVTDWTADHAFNLFNPALGTLNSVTATLDSDLAQSGLLTNNSSSVSETFTFTAGVDVLLNTGPAPLVAALDDSYSNATSRTTLSKNGTLAFGPYTQSTPSTYTSIPDDLSSFTGPGTFDFELATVSSETFAGGGGNVTAALDTTADATLTVTYDYTPTPGVPEPANWALMILGVGMVGGMLRRRSALATA